MPYTVTTIAWEQRARTLLTAASKKDLAEFLASAISLPGINSRPFLTFECDHGARLVLRTREDVPTGDTPMPGCPVGCYAIRIGKLA